MGITENPENLNEKCYNITWDMAIHFSLAIQAQTCELAREY